MMLNTLRNNPNLTFRKLVSFSAINGTGFLIFLVIQYAMTKHTSLHYTIITILGSGFVLLIKFVLAGVFTYKR